VGAKLKAFAKVAKAQYGSGVVGRGDTTPSDDRRLPSGSLRLDYALGGGYRVGWITSLYGDKSGGKTTTALHAMAESQDRCRNCYRPAKDVAAVSPSAAELEEDPDARWAAKGACTCYAEGLYKPEVPEFRDDKGGKVAANSKKYKEALNTWDEAMKENSYDEFICAWIDTENAFDKKWAEKIGVDTRRLFYVRPESAEEGIDIMHALVLTAEVDMMVLDSIAQLVPNKELEKSTEEWQQGLQARLVNKFARKLVSGSSVVAGSNRAITQIWINQVREKITMFGDPTVKPAGKGQEFAVHAEIRFKKSKQVIEDEQWGARDKGEVTQIPTTETFSFLVTKNRTAGTRGVESTYSQRMNDNAAGPAGQIIEDAEIFKMAMHYLVDQKKAGSATVYVLAGQEYTSQKKMAEDLRDDVELLSAVRKALLERMLKGAA